MLLGCIGDDFTGSSDLANTLAKGGMRTVQYTGVPTSRANDDVEAGVVALKSRSIPASEAVEQSLAAFEWLRDQGCKQFFFKYCSTFDSTPDGNIGPVADALVEALGAHRVVVCPAFPGTGRTVYQGHLFVKDCLLSESGMQDHPITPMKDPDLRRVLAAQSRHTVGHVSTDDVFAGEASIRSALDREDGNGHKYIVVDAVRDQDLYSIGSALKDLPLVTGGSGMAIGLPENFGCNNSTVSWSGETQGEAIVLAGSCSLTTRKQIDLHSKHNPVRAISVHDVMEGMESPEEIVNWLLNEGGLPLLYSSADPEKVTAAQEKYGAEQTSKTLEMFFADVASLAIDGGVTRLICAGGETSSAIVEKLGIQELQIGTEIDPGVPALRANENLVLSLKSGNFGADDFFVKADRILGGSL